MALKDKNKTVGWQQHVSFALSLISLLLVLAFFVQSSLEVYQREPLQKAIERLSLGEAAEPLKRRQQELP